MNHSNQNNPYLSIVIAGRNDNYGGDFEYRLQIAMNWFVYYANKYELHAEFIIVNYNPLPQAPLAETLQFPASSFVKFRIISVPPAFHQTVSDDNIRKKLPLYEYIAKNIGIRRAKGHFILSANPDILIAPSIIKSIANQNLKPDTYYRANRADYNKLPTLNPADGTAPIHNNIFRLFLKGYTFSFRASSFNIATYIKLKVKAFFSRQYDILTPRFADLANKYSIPVIYDNIASIAHSNCSGDFTLLHRNAWIALKGHPQNTRLPMHTDALTVSMAYFSGLKEHTFFWPVYHQHHERRFESDNSDPEINAMFRKFIDDSRVMQQQNAAIIYNDDNWGYPEENFDEVHFN